MSGTSLDGIDLASLTFSFIDTWKFEIHQCETIPYPTSWLHKLKELTSLSLQELNQIDEDYTLYLSEAINQFIKKNQLSHIDAVCSHGHTALHQPQNGLTYQIGNLPKLASLINSKVVCDFRVEDVALGGQGAPLVPVGDKLLFSNHEFCLNLGGFANISTENDGERIAYDICPANIVLNHYVNRLGFDFDDGGRLASGGKINHRLLEALNSLPFYHKEFPKSLGLEWVQKEVFPLIDSFQLTTEDTLRTFVEHVSIQIANEINKKNHVSVLVTGGGVYNNFLMERLNNFSNNKIVIPDKKLIEFKEALVFGFLGVLKLRNEVNCLSSVTGASKNHSSGKIYCP
ncbi:anhydro-N-acetylmuramic acid kinase [Gelidibacter algens]|uniref:Anhydro-N-acetylmuramic acid kinase n=3 Tax=Gelidibacter algens TaxID=49280 RepID=A0A327RSP3_9FLAO|nr:anhydro-N-acetylmuramic acid kinase [Gelidibacter algens]